MDRPVMDPTYANDPMGTPKEALLTRVCHLLKPAWRIARILLRVLVWNPLVRRREDQFRNEDGTPWQRIWRGICYRIAFLPVILAVVVGMFVWAGTHPQYAVAATDPNSRGVYYEVINFRTEKAGSTEAWLVPQVDARKVLDEGEQSLRKKYPAVVLVPDCGRGAEQMLLLIPTLHDAGFVVLAINTPRTSVLRSRGITFGLRESAEVQAAVATLRTRSFIDPHKIAIIGIGGGGNAALLAARRDPSIRTLVIDRPFSGAEDLRDRLGPARAGFQWMQPLCKWGFELGYQVDAEELDLKNFEDLLATRHILMFSQKDRVHLSVTTELGQIEAFLKQHLGK